MITRSEKENRSVKANTDLRKKLLENKRIRGTARNLLLINESDDEVKRKKTGKETNERLWRTRR